MRKILTCFEIFTCNSAKLKKYKYLNNINVILQFEFENSILHLLSLYINFRCAISKYIEISFQYLIKNKIPSYGWIAWRTEACLLFSYMYNSVHLYKRPINFGDLIGVTQWLLLVFGYTWVLSSFRLRIKPVPSVIFTIWPKIWSRPLQKEWAYNKLIIGSHEKAFQASICFIFLFFKLAITLGPFWGCFFPFLIEYSRHFI